MKPRVVFVPGIMGSVLVDQTLARDRGAAKAVCYQNMSSLTRLVVDTFANDPCTQDPSVVWGEFSMLHWVFDTDEWIRRMRWGNGIDNPSELEVQDYPNAVPSQSQVGLRPLDNLPQRNWGLTRVELVRRSVEITSSGDRGLPKVELTKEPYKTYFDPYGDFLGEMTKVADLLVFPYDWRLSNAYNATLLAAAIKNRWWRHKPDNEIRADERVTIIAHSMGGLIARFLIEASTSDLPYLGGKPVPLAGHRFVKQLVTIGTPHLGAPEPYLTAIGAISPLDNLEPSYIELTGLRAINVETNMIGGKPIDRTDLMLLMQSFSSVVEMFPCYRFMPSETLDGSAPALIDPSRDSKKIYESYLDWPFYQGGGSAIEELNSKRPSRQPLELLSSGGRRKPWKIFADFRRSLVAPDCLDQWLMARNVHYYAIGTSDYSTITGYDPKSNACQKPGRSGDGVVPWRSAGLYPWSDRSTFPGVDPRPQHLHWVPSSEVSVHNELLRSVAIQDLCLKIVLAPEHVRKDLKKVVKRPLGELESVNSLVPAIMRKIGFETPSSIPRRVVSVATFAFDMSSGASIFPVEFADDQFGVLREYIPETLGPQYKRTQVWSCEFPGLGMRRFVGIKARTFQAAYGLVCGGVIFLPESRCQDYLEILTWNLGELQTARKTMNNETHAEFQFADCIGKWHKHFEWQRRLRSIQVRNVGSRCYSPCSQCASGDLQEIGKLLGGRRDSPVGQISWRNLYDNTDGGGPTDEKDILNLTNSGWKIVGGSPLPLR